jgi:hypothetical protein
MSFRKSDRQVLLLVVVFGAVVVGTGGVVEGFRVPLGFVVAVVFLYWLLTDDRYGEDARPLRLEERQTETTKSLRREEFGRTLRRLYDELVKKEDWLSLDEYRRRSTELGSPQRRPIRCRVARLTIAGETLLAPLARARS